jgi:hypothetical protein
LTVTQTVNKPADSVFKMAGGQVPQGALGLALNAKTTVEYSSIDRDGLFNWNELNVKGSIADQTVLSVTATATRKLVSESVQTQRWEIPTVQALAGRPHRPDADASAGSPARPSKGKSGDASGDADTQPSLPPDRRPPVVAGQSGETPPSPPRKGKAGDRSGDAD